MTPKDLAVKEMKEELKRQNKSFLAFHNDLNPMMRRLVFSQIKQQLSINPFTPRHKSQLIARCFFCKGQVKLINYSKYYANR